MSSTKIRCGLSFVFADAGRRKAFCGLSGATATWSTVTTTQVRAMFMSPSPSMLTPTNDRVCNLIRVAEVGREDRSLQHNARFGQRLRARRDEPCLHVFMSPSMFTSGSPSTKSSLRPAASQSYASFAHSSAPGRRRSWSAARTARARGAFTRRRRGDERDARFGRTDRAVLTGQGDRSGRAS